MEPVMNQHWALLLFKSIQEMKELLLIPYFMQPN